MKSPYSYGEAPVEHQIFSRVVSARLRHQSCAQLQAVRMDACIGAMHAVQATAPNVCVCVHINVCVEELYTSQTTVEAMIHVLVCIAWFCHAKAPCSFVACTETRKLQQGSPVQCMYYNIVYTWAFLRVLQP